MNTKRSKGKAPSPRFSKAQLHFALFNLWQIYFVEKWGRDHRVFCLPCVIHFSFRNASTLSWKNILNGNYQNIRDLRGFFKVVLLLRASKPLTLAKYVFNVSDTIWEPTFWQRRLGKRKMKLPLAMQLQLDLSCCGEGNLLQFLPIDIWVFS